MTETTLTEAPAANASQALAAADCDECAASGGWFRYEPALDPAPGRLYLSCLQCRGSGRTVVARA